MSHMVRERKGVSAMGELYEYIGFIGKGSVGMIAKVRHRQTGVEYAMKTIQLAKFSRSILKEMRNEIEVLKRLDHPNTIRAIETFEEERQMYLIMKLCTGGDLRARTPYSEKAVANIVTKLLSATCYMHEKGICHRDLKLENVVYESKAPDSDIFIIDYGLSKIANHEEMDEVVGTLYTMAPEVVAGKNYDNSCDMWSIGVMTFVLLSGTMPFPMFSAFQLKAAIAAGTYDFSGPRWTHISYEAKSFVRRLIKRVPSERLTAQKALQHRWISDWMASEEPALSSTGGRGLLTREDHDRIVASMKNFASYGKVKKIGLMLVAYRSPPEQTKAMRHAFSTYDVDLNGRVSREEFQSVLKEQGYTDEELVGLFDEMDDDQDGYMHYTEFLAATLETQGKELAEERLADAFDWLDSDDTHNISKENLVHFFGKDGKGHDVAKLIEDADENRSGGIDLHEFIKLMRERGKFSIPPSATPSPTGPTAARRKHVPHAGHTNSSHGALTAPSDATTVGRGDRGDVEWAQDTPGGKAKSRRAKKGGVDESRNVSTPLPNQQRDTWTPELLFGDGPPPTPP